ncbi:hypothetical protein LZ32DRAFT_28622 [Colletotrichum eremochloae]|nr:hypothetical protein LZ32DRAFT_28622 [Colletotrichum eremochloae]
MCLSSELLCVCLFVSFCLTQARCHIVVWASRRDVAWAFDSHRNFRRGKPFSLSQSSSTRDYLFFSCGPNRDVSRLPQKYSTLALRAPINAAFVTVQSRSKNKLQKVIKLRTALIAYGKFAT